MHAQVRELEEASKKEQILKFDIPNVLSKIIIDEERVDQIKSNLINNALKYNKRNGQFVLRVSSEKDNVIIEVRDEGMGIEEKNLVKPLYDFLQENIIRYPVGLLLYLSVGIA